ncbi:hypothetical protein WJX72_010963 [[Myrmecia] bisecta]|uniref:Serine hydrolase domain-containing protein n=1 Tax=[Myrmecia] bisecta TaxID=41462 RepID=A0AAW1R9R7_9CHLO
MPKREQGQGERQKLRILCLHGYLQNAETFRAKIGSVRKALKSRAEFFFVDAPHPVQIQDEQQVQAEGGTRDSPRAWWTWKDLEPGMRPSRAAHYDGWDVSVKVLADSLQRHAPIDGVLGFSQGATAAALLLAQATSEPGIPAPSFAVLIGGFLPRDDTFAGWITTAKPSTPVLFVFGVNDVLVPPERSHQLIAAFAGPHIQQFEHAGAHMVPTCSGEFKQQLQQFLDDFISRQEAASG